MTNEEMIQKYYDGDDSMLENCTMKTSVLYTTLQKKLPLHSIASIKKKTDRRSLRSIQKKY